MPTDDAIFIPLCGPKGHGNSGEVPGRRSRAEPASEKSGAGTHPRSVPQIMWQWRIPRPFPYPYVAFERPWSYRRKPVSRLAPEAGRRSHPDVLRLGRTFHKGPPGRRVTACPEPAEGMRDALRWRIGASAGYSTRLRAASTSDRVAKPSNLAVTTPPPSITKVHSMLGSDHSVTAGDMRALSRSPWISWGLS